MGRTARPIIALLITGSLAVPHLSPAAAAERSLIELFTSQGCSSCPPADALAGRLSTDPTLLVLSFHVNYWDDLGWKDPFASQVTTDRQYTYARTLNERTVFTPQVIVNGTQSVIGSQEAAVRKAIAAVGAPKLSAHADLLKQADGSFNLVLTGPAVIAEIWEVRYLRHAITKVGSGENRGRELETFNNVTQLRRVGAFESGVLKLPPLRQPEDGLAVLIQKPAAGQILGMAVY